MKKTIVLGADVGGSHITSALVDIEAGELISGTEAREVLNSTGTMEEIISTWIKCLRSSLSGVATDNMAIGIATPGPFDYDGGISLIRKQDKFRSLYGHPLKPLLSGTLGISGERIFFMNDACSFLKGEMLGGALRGQEHVMGITLGTGLGSAFSVNGVVADADLWQSPFGDGMAEDYLSTRWFTTRYFELSGRSIRGVKDLVELPPADQIRQQLFAEFAGNLSTFLLQQQAAKSYTNIVIGGNIAKAAPYFTAQLGRLVGADSSKAPKYCFALLGEKAALIGAAGMAYSCKQAGRPV